MLLKENIHITPFNLDRTLHIYLPDDYNETDERYPVMYMYDGHNLFLNEDATYGKSWGLVEYLSESQLKLIIIGIECNHEGESRLDEFCPYDFINFHHEHRHGKGKVLMKWVVDELKPYIDSKYRTLKDRKHTGIGGSSMGGLMSVYTVTAHNDVFSRAACVSSALGFCYKDLMEGISQNGTLDPDTRIYLSWGSEEPSSKKDLVKYTWANLELNHLLTQLGASTYPYIQQEGRHCETDWEKQNSIYMPFLWN